MIDRQPVESVCSKPIGMDATMTVPTITINMDKKCAECGQSGAADSGLCMACTLKTIQGKPMKSQLGRAVQRRNRKTLDEFRKLKDSGP